MGGSLKGILCLSIVAVLVASAAVPVLSQVAAPADGDDRGRALSDVDLFDSYKDYKKPPAGVGGGGGAAARVSVTFTHPTNGDVVDGTVWVTVSASSKKATIASIELFIDGTSQGSETSSFAWEWVTNDYSDADHTLAATATDSNGATGSATITVTVDNAGADVDKWAVVIGISDYKGGRNDLRYCDDDALDMYDFLVASGYPTSHIKLLVDSAAKGAAIYAAIDWMADKEGEGSECVFFYSGHGSTVYDTDGDETSGPDEAIVCYELLAITDDSLADAFFSFECAKLALIFDSCFSGGMDDLAGTGRVVVTASSETQLSWDGSSEMVNGVFSYYYIEGLYSKGTVEGAFYYAEDPAHEFVYDEYNYQMDPQLDDQYTGDWEF